MFKNLFPDEFPNGVVPPHSQIVRPSKLLRERGAKWYDYVVTEDGSLVIGQRIPGQGHANLAQGTDVKAAGQVQVSGGRIIQIDNASGHYLPTGNQAQSNAMEAFRREGFNLDDNVYVEKSWNNVTELWEPIGG